jgi:hypothetical protein
VTFHFEASLPAHAAFLAPLQEMLRQAYVYMGYPAGEASDIARGIEQLVARGLPGEGRGADIRLRLERDARNFHVDVGAEHLPASPASVALIDHVSVRRDGARTTHRFTRELPRS